MARRIYKRRGMTMSFEVKARQCECKVESAECKMVRGWKFTARGTNHGIHGIHGRAFERLIAVRSSATEKNEEIRYLRRKCRMRAVCRAGEFSAFSWLELVIAG